MENEELILLQKKVSLLRSEGKYKETIEACYQLLADGTRLNDPTSMMMAHIHKAASYYSIGAMEQAFASIESHQDLCATYGDDKDKLNSYNLLFLLHECNKNYTEAKATLENSIALGEKLKHYNIVSCGYSNFSHVYNVEGKYEEALEMAQMGLEMATLHDPQNSILAFRVKLNIANAYIGLEDRDASKSMIDELINDPILDSFIREKTQCYDLQGRWYTKQKDYREAFESFTQAKNLAESYHDVNLLKSIQEQRCTLCELMNDVPLGYQVQKEYIALLNEISDRDLALTALKLDIKHRITSIEMKAYTDYLTGLYNRSYLETTADKWLKQAATTKESIVCIALDLDNLKTINDEYGHLFGDEVIKLVGGICQDNSGENAIVGRFGGDEFVIILKGITLENGKKKAQQLAESVKNMAITKEGKMIVTTASIGVADNSDCREMTFKELFNTADMALYRAKVNGKNQIYCLL
ncbi:diguanylate cyclase [Sporosarcina sp. NPDC096371]|uniref:tetratricopeptide repeat-containing diguanylate cyclase n=1 Tax=Sporosarcina sp. NPDC096371 TaxID=3364530 RepID=UPI0037F7D4A0